MEVRRLLLILGLALALPLQASRPPQALLPTCPGEPALWTTFISCVSWVEQWAGPSAPDWVFHSSAYSFQARKPLYDALGRPLLDDAGRQRCSYALESGRVFFPPAWRVRDPARMPIVIYSHGTSLLKAGVASEFNGHEWIFGAAAAAYYGFAVALPDQPGMGVDSMAYHPFCHAPSLAFAVVDGIPAIRARFREDAYVARNHYAWDGRIFLLGYSEGGYASLAAAREMETHRSDYGGDGAFWLAGSACMAGPFDLSGTTRRQLLDPAAPFQHPFFIPFVIYGYHGVYGNVMDPREILAPAILAPGEDGSIQEWADGSRDGPTVDAHLASRLGVDPGQVVLRSLLNPGWVARELADPGFQTSPLKGILAENDVATGWTPTRPILFCQSPDDQDVPLGNTLSARATLGEAMRKAGRDPKGTLMYQPLGRPGCGIGHVAGVFLAVPRAFDWIYRGMPDEGTE